jgi:hypothetical protein
VPDTVSVPETFALVVVPPADTISVPPELTTVPVAVAPDRTVCDPPERTFVARAVPEK